VTAVLADPSPGETSLTFENEGGQTAVQTAYLLAADTGTDSRQVGDIPPGDSTSVRVSRVTREPVQCVWSCFDGRGRLIVWSYDGRHKRVRHGRASRGFLLAGAGLLARRHELDTACELYV